MVTPVDASCSADLARIHADSFLRGWSVAEIESLLRPSGALCFAAHSGSDQPLAGFVLIHCIADEAEIITLAICRNMRRRGMARALLSRSIQILRQNGITSVFLEVAENNGAALALYSKHGFDLTGRRVGYYVVGTQRHDALVLKLIC